LQAVKNQRKNTEQLAKTAIVAATRRFENAGVWIDRRGYWYKK